MHYTPIHKLTPSLSFVRTEKREKAHKVAGLSKYCNITVHQQRTAKKAVCKKKSVLQYGINQQYIVHRMGYNRNISNIKMILY